MPICSHCKKEVDEDKIFRTLEFYGYNDKLIDKEYYCSEHCLEYGWIRVGND